MRVSERFSLAANFESFCIEVLKMAGASITEIEGFGNGRDQGYDFIINTERGAIAVEVKTRSKHNLSYREIRSIYERIHNGSEVHSFKYSLLITNTEVTDSQFEEIRREMPHLIVLDAGSLWELVAGDEKTLRDLQGILSNLNPFTGNSPTTHRSNEVTFRLLGLTPIGVPTDLLPPFLCNDLKAIPSGQPNSSNFENALTETLKFLFDGELTAWSFQQRTDTGMSINDLLARNNSSQGFWKTLREHFESVYVIFEFKNYSNAVAQSQVYSTERYLYRSALRNTAIIISPKGLNENGQKAARGALREHGKLILSITVDDVCKMIAAKLNGDDPSIVLSELLDTMLMKIER
ncbi:restriction endonuclease [Primorskyibacter sp. 2E107]|uniref:restriction endonuclease n=1 Tax=Primorskyibacter sp. 2E107 TaxID=3403458 RepID=UPI003AF72155